eukprot:205093-Pelagomonas_calceolata.AAC.2
MTNGTINDTCRSQVLERKGKGYVIVPAYVDSQVLKPGPSSNPPESWWPPHCVPCPSKCPSM